LICAGEAQAEWRFLRRAGLEGGGRETRQAEFLLAERGNEPTEELAQSLEMLVVAERRGRVAGLTSMTTLSAAADLAREAAPGTLGGEPPTATRAESGAAECAGDALG